MGIVVRFALRHARASSAACLAAKVVRSSAVTPFKPATSVPKIADHHSAGTLSRCHHFETVDDPAPISADMASREGQSSIRARKERISTMDNVIGHSVLKSKAISSLDGKTALGHTVPMAASESETQYKQGFIARTREARISRALKQWELADALGMPQDKYKQYETRSLLPHHLIGRFCIICRVDPEWLITGRGKMAPPAPTEPPPAPRTLPKPRHTRGKRAA